MNLSKRLELILPLAQSAGDIMLKYLNSDKNIEHKADVNLLTRADTECEQLIFDFLSSEFTEDAILAEEGHTKNGTSGFEWVIDPIDGTTSYAHGFPFFAVSIALLNEKKESVLGVVFNPFFNEMYTALQGAGSYLNGKPLHVSKVQTLSRSLLATGFPYNRRERMPLLMKRLATVLHTVHDIRRTGSAALDICSVAAGRTDGYYEEGLQPWDTAAAILILKEAGGKATNFTGGPADIFKPEICVSNGLIHDELTTLLKDAHLREIH